MREDKNSYYILPLSVGGHRYSEKNIKWWDRNKILPHMVFYHDRKNIIEKLIKLLQFSSDVLSDQFIADVWSVVDPINTYSDVYNHEVFRKDLNIDKSKLKNLNTKWDIYDLSWYRDKVELLEDVGLIIDERTNEHHMLPRSFWGKKKWINVVNTNATVHMLFHQSNGDCPINIQLAKTLDFENKALKKEFKKEMVELLIQPLDYFYKTQGAIDPISTVKKFDDRDIISLRDMFDKKMNYDEGYRYCCDMYKNYSEKMIKKYNLIHRWL